MSQGKSSLAGPFTSKETPLTEAEQPQSTPRTVQQWLQIAEAATSARENDKAIQAYQQAISLDSQHPGLPLLLGNVYAEIQDNVHAIECYGASLRLDPACAMAWHNLGNIFLRLQDLPSAAACFQNAVQLNEKDGSFHYSLGRILDMTGKHQEALGHLLEATKLEPQHCDSWTNLGNVCQHLGKYPEALSCYDEALKLTPNSAELHVNRAVVLLNQGNFAEGWKEYEQRWETSTFQVYKRRSFGCPAWNGEALRGKRLFLHAEQGYGDAIQFARFIPEVLARGAEVFLEVGPPLAELLKQMVPAGHVIIRGEQVPPCDYHCSLISLAYWLNIALETLPNAPYLSTSAEEQARAKKLIDSKIKGSPKLRVGLCWRGNPGHRWDHLRSVPQNLLSAFEALPDVQWFLLQRDVTEKERSAFPPEGNTAVFENDELNGFLAIGALAQELDIIVTIDTALAHLAGALGKPLWLMLPTFYEWRWHTHLKESPWYPSARLFRQDQPGDWQSVITKIAHALKERTRG